MNRFSIIIVTWNALHHLKRFLPSVSRHSKGNEIILADNASSDATRDWVEQNFPEMKVVTLDKNYGYCGGNNRGAACASNELLVFLNNDAEVTKGWLDPIAAMFDKDEKLAAVQPKIRSVEQKTHFEHAGAAGGFIDRHTFPFCRGRIFDAVEADVGQYDDRTEIFWASGAAMVIRRDLFLQTGGFDEDFEFHMEEIDLCWQLWNQGYKVEYCPDSLVYHLGGGSMAAGSSRKFYYNFRNSLAMIVKNSSSATLMKRLLTRIMLDQVAFFKALLTLRLGEVSAIWRAHLHFLKNVDHFLKKRDMLQKKRIVIRDPHTMLDISIVKHYFLRGIRKFSDLPASGSGKKISNSHHQT